MYGLRDRAAYRIRHMCGLYMTMAYVHGDGLYMAMAYIWRWPIHGHGLYMAMAFMWAMASMYGLFMVWGNAYGLWPMFEPWPMFCPTAHVSPTAHV